MTLTVLATGLFVTFAAVVWAALVLWGIVSPREAPEPERKPGQRRTPPPPVVPGRAAPEMPVVFLPEPPGPSVAPPSDGKVVNLAEWREEKERTG